MDKQTDRQTQRDALEPHLNLSKNMQKRRLFPRHKAQNQAKRSRRIKRALPCPNSHVPDPFPYSKHTMAICRPLLLSALSCQLLLFLCLSLLPFIPFYLLLAYRTYRFPVCLSFSFVYHDGLYQSQPELQKTVCYLVLYCFRRRPVVF
ncbi:hypothetical protein K457DRAFT_552033 [Linnemannia elongata AG-77]|uniref:Transmembrane protein n=1 Tax=Linnemannia elongata AG-77 TaxID=1314771 RepID=A0A197JVL7_9FUNG|nr:hypothetical protein K457DRAFT_552033 [Linnemannia elongata AG-77]